ncbi:peptidoglycan editing factor PgeF [Gephyromycinifex aptenodytis]|uniref:peptidoglycan editing factor PgeF n=1 Tax=Gephyromycinifex aptenodytis TaxID=2716227 RepID=UPI0014488184|nr:peptidoglycan editing factor PgeF [Gephyromycinifex aptenodytis]
MPRSLVDWGFTRATPTPAGVSGSRGDYLGFNLASHVGDDPVAVQSNRRALAAQLGVATRELIFMNQVHGSQVVVADGPWSGDPPEADAVLTTTPGLALAVLVADCTPVLLVDEEAGVAGAVHAGRPGLLAGVVPAAVHAARDLGARRLRAAVGPSVCGRCYEVPAAMREEVAADNPLSATVSWTGTPALDVAAGVVAQLRQLDVALTWVPGCTRESPRFYSYRRQPRTGRFAGVVRMWTP